MILAFDCLCSIKGRESLYEKRQEWNREDNRKASIDHEQINNNTMSCKFIDFKIYALKISQTCLFHEFNGTKGFCYFSLAHKKMLNT